MNERSDDLDAALAAVHARFPDRLSAEDAARLSRQRVRDRFKRVICGARTKRNGLPCRAKSEPGKRRCKWHGGLSTGPKTPEGKARALANLRKFRRET